MERGATDYRQNGERENTMRLSPSDQLTFFFLSVVGVGLLLVTVTSCSPHYSDGTRTGIITKLSHKGLFSKTWEGEMNLGGMVNGGGDKGMVANVWKFTVEYDSIINTVKEAAADGRRVTLIYHEWLKRPVFKTDTGYMVSGIADPSMVERVEFVAP